MSRRDDIQSLFYIMIYLLNDGTLPWTDFGKKFKHLNFTFEDYLMERIDIKYCKQIVEMCPNSLKPLLKKIMVLEFTEEPPYD